MHRKWYVALSANALGLIAVPCTRRTRLRDFNLFSLKSDWD